MKGNLALVLFCLISLCSASVERRLARLSDQEVSFFAKIDPTAVSLLQQTEDATETVRIPVEVGLQEMDEYS